MKNYILLLSMLLILGEITAQNFPNTVINGRLKVSDNKRFLVHENDKPFYWLGDTAWELFHRLNREDAEKYLKTRAEQGFTVIQAVGLAEVQGLRDPNPYWELPLKDLDPTKPNDAYFQHVDWIIDKAAELGLYIAFLPTWGDKLNKASWGDGPEIFNADNAKVYGKWVGNRYKDRKNVLWVLIGDRNPRDEKEVTVWRAMAAGITEGVGGADKALITAHPQPNDMADGGAGKWFHNDAWFDFNMFQTGHCRENPVYDRIQVAYNRLPTKPTIDGESIYEDHPVCFNVTELNKSSAYDVRTYAYWDVFAGAFGNTYGCHDVWQMYSPDRKSVNNASMPWQEALNLPGAKQMKFVRKLIESRPMLDRVPDQSLVADPFGVYDRIQATRGKDYAFIYSTKGKAFELILGKISGQRVVANWYDPRTGAVKEAGTYDNKGKQKFQPPTEGYGEDWILILDDAAKNYAKP